MSKSPTPIKVHELVNWLVDIKASDKIPNRFEEQRGKLGSLVPYITEQLWLRPQLITYLNKHLNDLYNIPDPIEALSLLKKIFRIQKISKFDLYQAPFNFQPKIVEAIEDKEGYDQNNAASKAMLMSKLGVSYDQYIKPAATKANVKKNSSAEVAKVVEVALKEDAEKAIDESPTYIKTLNQEIIDQEELILFDVSLLKKTNKVLFIFIDKKNHKKYHLKPFMAKVYLSKEDGVINNDYIEELDPNKFMGYIIRDIKLYTKLKYMLNHSYKNILKPAEEF